MVELSEKERRSIRSNFDLKAAFNCFDVNGCGSIRAVELKECMVLLGLEPTQAELLIVSAEHGLDMDGNLTFDLFLKIMKSCTELKRNGERPRRPSMRGQVEDYQTEVHCIVYTGGPCTSRAVVVDAIVKALSTKGISIVTAPDVRHVLEPAGCVLRDICPEYVLPLLHLQMQLEQTFTQIAFTRCAPSLVLLDRGIFDLRSGLSVEAWSNIMTGGDFEESDLLARYDGVLHLVTCADGAESLYEPQCGETAEEALRVDANSRASWWRHCDVGLMSNTADGTDGKIERSLEFVTQQLLEKPMAAWQPRRASPKLANSNNESKVLRLACTGDSQSLADLRCVVESKGIDFYIVPEVTPILAAGGCDPTTSGGEKRIVYEVAAFQLQLQLENTIVQIASANRKPSVVVSCRGVMSVAVQLPTRTWAKVLEALRLTERTLEKAVSQRYDTVLHMPCRAGEDTEFERKLVSAWSKHPSVVRIEEESDEGRHQLIVDTVTSWVAHRIAALPDGQRLLFEKELLSSEILKLFPSNTTSGERVISPAKFTSLMQHVGAEWSNEQTDSLLSAAGMQDKEQVPLEDLFKWVFVSPVL